MTTEKEHRAIFQEVEDSTAEVKRVAAELAQAQAKLAAPLTLAETCMQVECDDCEKLIAWPLRICAECNDRRGAEWYAEDPEAKERRP